jgi:hypothetical protein
MAAINDLTWQQLNEALGETGQIFLGEDTQGNIGVLISVSTVNGSVAGNLSTNGVVKFLMRLREAAAEAQILINETQAVGEKLNAFPPSTSNGTVINGAITQTGSIQAAIVVSSASEVVGTVI